MGQRYTLAFLFFIPLFIYLRPLQECNIPFFAQTAKNRSLKWKCFISTNNETVVCWLRSRTHWAGRVIPSLFYLSRTVCVALVIVENGQTVGHPAVFATEWEEIEYANAPWNNGWGLICRRKTKKKDSKYNASFFCAGVITNKLVDIVKWIFIFR